MEENKTLVTELPLPFDEKDLEELKSAKCIIDYRGDGKPVMEDGQPALSYNGYWWENSKEKQTIIFTKQKESKDSLFLYCYDNICRLLDLIMFRDFTSTLYTLEDLSS